MSDLAELGTLLQNSLAEGCTSLVLDLAHCTDFPPHAAGLLNRLADEAHAVGGRLAVHGVPSFDAMMLRADGLAPAIDIVLRDAAMPIEASPGELGATA
ncbi:hypothetical protein BJ980_001322 [Nocardioides daedukensis]|uniref:STAS domain-containing protein n=1 Tax=Nocardioides daedukensis TaxID=634462 RepID=A0A7Y9RZX1_9ACTN|nr:hypothetical protein [Nocardioides daedukensis]NYG58399.1 hypothetical protein [Nocardioides daedukensis]